MSTQLKYLSIFLLALSLSCESYSQKLIKGIVVDSATLNNLQGVHVKIQHTNHATTTNQNGVFTIIATEQDTLIFSYVGYAKQVLPIYLEDETMFVRMREESILLKEVVIRDRFMLKLDEKYINSPTLQGAKPIKAGSTSGGVGVNFSYFSKQEKEKRKLSKIIAENEKVRTYIEMVNDPDLKNEIMTRYGFSEEKFYDLLAIYNEKNKDIMYSSNSGLILNSLLSYYEQASRQK